MNVVGGCNFYINHERRITAYLMDNYVQESSGTALMITDVKLNIVPKVKVILCYKILKIIINCL